ncbi:cell division protein FtsZ [Kiloniella laminariae]|uniref:Cell division protein FtsZ n=1 Tax=Kiloniella laminariae TaxID=454162 RepID=A0ABT4LDV9_9PROT|nr:cell division protein FtsZ [Kiloniella laminariae]MCZ4279287.1 cell division protein FtsZ [Kiloniella laminariae]
MALNLDVPPVESELTPRITVIGVGGAGGNAVNNMIQSNLEGVEFLIANTDAQAIAQSSCERTIQLGRNITQGLGAGSRPDIGHAAAEEAMDEILGHLEGSNMVFITAGMGGGTGTGAAPVIAKAARDAGILTVGVITKPFHFEGVHRMRLAEKGIEELAQYVDTLIIIPNQNLFRIANEKTTFADAFKMADDVLRSGVSGVTDLMVMPGLINLDFADIRAVMTEMGKAMMGTGEASGETRAMDAAEAAISNPLLDEVSMKGARGVLINITGGPDLTLFEVDEAANRIRDEVDPEANIIFGSTFDPNMDGTMRVSVVATGIDAESIRNIRPAAQSFQTPPAPLNVSPEPKAEPAEEMVARAETAPAQGPSMAPQPAAAQATASSQPIIESGPAHTSIEAAITRSEAEGQNQRNPQQMAPQAEIRNDSFVAPRPVTVSNQKPAAPQAAPQKADPFAAAAMANGTDRFEESKKSKGLFGRITGGAARALQAATQADEQEELQTGRATPAAAAPAVATATAPAESAPAAPAQQPRLTGLDPHDRIQSPAADEDLLDIPAFLRRQAN